MKEQLVSEIQCKMLTYLNNEQMMQLRFVLNDVLKDITVSCENDTIVSDERNAVEAFI